MSRQSSQMRRELREWADYSPRRREYDGEQVRDGHRHEHEVGRGPHVLLAEHDDDQDVADERDGEDQRHHEAVDRHREVAGAVPRGAVHVAAATRVEALAQRMNLSKIIKERSKNNVL